MVVLVAVGVADGEEHVLHGGDGQAEVVHSQPGLVLRELLEKLREFPLLRGGKAHGKLAAHVADGLGVSDEPPDERLDAALVEAGALRHRQTVAAA